jgi:hypothetical protein
LSDDKQKDEEKVSIEKAPPIEKVPAEEQNEV